MLNHLFFIGLNRKRTMQTKESTFTGVHIFPECAPSSRGTMISKISKISSKTTGEDCQVLVKVDGRERQEGAEVAEAREVQGELAEEEVLALVEEALGSAETVRCLVR